MSYDRSTTMGRRSPERVNSSLGYPHLRSTSDGVRRGLPPPSVPPPAAMRSSRPDPLSSRAHLGAATHRVSAEEELRQAELRFLEREHSIGTPLSPVTIQRASERDRMRRAEAEKELLNAEHDALRMQLADTRRVLGQKSSIPDLPLSLPAPSQPPKAETKASQIEDSTAPPSRLCNFFTSLPAQNHINPDSAMPGDSELTAINTALVHVEAKLKTLAEPLQKIMKYRPLSQGSRPQLTNEEEVLVHTPIISEGTHKEELQLLQKWGELRTDFDKMQGELDGVPVAKDKEGTSRIMEIFYSVVRRIWYYVLIVTALVVYIFIVLTFELDTFLLQLWTASIVIGIAWIVGVLQGYIPLWMSILFSAVICVTSIITIMINEEESEGSGASIALPLMILASSVSFVALTERKPAVLVELTETDVGARDDLFKAVLSGDLPAVQREAAAAPWRLRCRDMMTATPLHCALLRAVSSPKHNDIAHWILAFIPHLALDIYTDKIFEGVSGLHFAIAHRDVCMTHKLAHIAPSTLMSRAVGTFFQSEDTYFGETPLQFAVTTNQPDVVMFLLKLGAERLRVTEKEQLMQRDKNNNSLLHLCVHNNLPKMYDYVEYLMECYDADITTDVEGVFNTDLFTPFTLSAHLGHKEIFIHLVEKNTQEVWQLGSTRCRRMWLDEVDPVAAAPMPLEEGEEEGGGSSAMSTSTSVSPMSRILESKPHVKGVLQLLIDNEQIDLLMVPAIKELLSVKWNTFVERIWLAHFGMLMIFVMAFSIVAFYGPMARSQNDSSYCAQDYWFGSEEPYSGILWAVWCSVSAYPLQRLSELVVVLGTIYRATVEFKQMRSLPPGAYFSKKGSMFFEQVSIITFMGFIVGAVCFRIAGSVIYEDFCLAMGALALWSYVLHELLGFRGTGPFVVMIWNMLGSDLMRFFIIFATFLIGFTQALYLLVNKYGTQYFFTRLMGCFVALLGQADISALIIEEDSSSFPYTSTALLLVYVLMVSILLLNLLIAMMTTTYQAIYDESDKVWNLEWARIILAVESRLSQKEKNSDGYRYWGEDITPEGPKRYFLLPSRREEDKNTFVSVPPRWPLNAPHSLSIT